jgi:formylmethanofuran dehydrogenase subunit C
MKVTLTVKERKKPNLPIEAESIVPKHFLEGHGALSVWKGNKELTLDEVFEVSVEGEAASVDEVEIVIRGDSSKIKRVGEYMDGMHCGNFMSAGTIEIDGNAAEWLGREMVGGTIVCRGDAGSYCGSGYRGEKRGMRGGTIEVMGSAGDFAAETLTGGTVIIHGDAGDFAGAEMHEGMLRIMGDTGRVCANMTGGTCYVHGCARAMLPTFKNEGGIVIGEEKFTKFTGDIANRGKGTLFIKEYQYID